MFFYNFHCHDAIKTYFTDTLENASQNIAFDFAVSAEVLNVISWMYSITSRGRALSYTGRASESPNMGVQHCSV